jgi:hypothetical protein
MRDINPFQLSLKDPRGYRDLADPFTRQMVIDIALLLEFAGFLTPLDVCVEDGKVFVWDGLLCILAVMQVMNVFNSLIPKVLVRLISRPILRAVSGRRPIRPVVEAAT